MVLTVSTDPLGARFFLAPFDEWVATFRIDRDRYLIEADYFPEGIPDGQQDHRRSRRPIAGVRAVR
ncbi:hypothetical protein GCM10008985_00270 [Halococcus dombrowskii]|uniref:Uncharacterized protein n=1 Tax=Halococcus dombrowskii TaxID=179637 RepID=A0AAV3SB93_HALDO